MYLHTRSIKFFDFRFRRFRLFTEVIRHRGIRVKLFVETRSISIYAAYRNVVRRAFVYVNNVVRSE